MKKMFIFSILAGLLQSSTCIKKKYCENDLKFKINFTLTPKDTFRIGDTLWVKMFVPDTLLDLNSQQLMFVPNIELATEIILGRLEQKTGILSTHLFEVVPKIGSVKLRPPAALKCLLDTLGVHQRFQIGLIPQKEGVYRFLPNFTFDEANHDVTITRNECTDVVNIIHYTNEGDCNFELLKLFSADSLTEAQYRDDGVYGFVVIPR